MPELFVILIKVNIALVLFCLGYYLVLRKLTFYTLNRAYLVTAIIFSSIYPFIDLSVFAQQHQEIIAPVQNVVIMWQVPTQNFVKQAAYWNWLEIIFWAGAALFTLRLLFQLVSLYRIYSRSTAREINGQMVRVVTGDISPFSFWKSIYINPEKLSDTDLKNVLEHEQIHVSEWHTLDVLLTEISVIFYWFNPGIWMMKRAVRENIEFITDRKILNKGLDSKAYQYSLLNITFNQPAPAISSNFNFSTLKKRIQMMNAKQSSNLNLTRYAFLMPVVAVCLFVFSLSKTETAKASPAFKTVTAVVENIKSIAFKTDTTPVKKTVTNQKTTKASATSAKEVVINTIQGQVSQTELLGNIEKNSVMIRGLNLNDSIIFVVDGKIFSNDINQIDPNTIRTVSVIKDNATAYLNQITGSNATGTSKLKGVIVITTVDGPKEVVSVRPGANDVVQVRGYGNYNTSPQRADTTSISLRASAAGTNAPLILVDGKEYSSINGINPNDIESVSVLKDGSATATYSYNLKAKNGVIIITTKKKY
jgi:bla regulator protein BlaR1